MLSLEVPRKDVLQQDWRHKPYMAFYRVTADESGKLRDKRCEYTSFCGYFGLAAEWERFELTWLSHQSKWAVPPIHMSKIFRPDEDERWSRVKDRWGKRWESARDEMLNEFASIVFSSSISAVGGVVDVEHFRNMPDSNYKRAARDPIFLSQQLMIVDSIDRAEMISSFRAPISLVIDDDQEFAMECYKNLNVLKATFPQVKERISGICFVNDDAYQGVQAADMIAYEARKRAIDKKKDPNSEPSMMYLALTHNLANQPRLVLPEVLDVLNRSMDSEAKSAESGV